VKAKSEPLRYEPPCAACGGPHRLEDCATEAAARLLADAGNVMSAVKVRARIGGGR
jgi:hypothetical protein